MPIGFEGIRADVGESLVLIMTGVSTDVVYAQWKGYYRPTKMGTKRTYKTTLADA